MREQFQAIKELSEKLKAAGIEYEWSHCLDGYQITIPGQGEKWKASVVQSSYSYGHGENLLEYWERKWKEPRGYMTVDEVYRMIKEMSDGKKN